MKSAMEIATIVNQNMPSIGFLSRSKRIDAFNTACHMIEDLATDDGEIDMEKAAEAAAMLTHLNNKFHKALFMTALNVDRLPIGHLNELAYGLAQGTKGLMP
jgi:hypothetical protein